MPGHVRQRSPGSWELRYSAGRDPVTGKRHTKTVTIKAAGKRAAEKELARLVSKHEAGDSTAPGKLTVGGWFEQWLAMIRPELSPLTVRGYEQCARNYLVPALGNVTLAKLTAAHIQTLYSRLAEGGRVDGRAGTLSSGTRRLIHKTLHSCLARAVELQVPGISKNPALVLRRRLPKEERASEMVVLNAADLNRLLDAARGTDLFAPILLAVATGARRGEVCALAWRNVDLVKAVVSITESAREPKRGQVTVGQTKTGKARRVTLPASAVAGLRAWRLEQAEQLLRLGVRQGPATPVCTRPDGVRLRPDILTENFGDLARRLGLAVHFHSLRHSHATALMLAGVHPKVIQERLGHASAGFTLTAYGHVVEQMADDAAARLDDLLSGR